MNDKVRVRFAPSPTGPLHIGGVRTALFNYLFARQNQGKMILRIEDTDQNRYVAGAEEYIIESLKWCGIHFDEGVREGGPYGPYRQSERQEIYRSYAALLVEKGDAYYAWDRPEDLDKAREAAEKKGERFLYNHESRVRMRNSLSLSQKEIESLNKNKEPYVIRFKTEPGQTIVLNDIIRGEILVQSDTLDDKVLLKADGMPTYHLANVVDDYLMKITHVIRGEEWLPSLPLHYLLYHAFGWEKSIPRFAHLPLILKPQGKGKLSKRDGEKMGFPVYPLEWISPDGERSVGYREAGYLPEALVNMLALLGWNPGTDQEVFTIKELIRLFSLGQVGKSGARFDPQKAVWFNHQHLQRKDNRELALWLTEEYKKRDMDIPTEKAEKIIPLIKDRVDFLHQLLDTSEYFFVPPENYDEKTVRKKWKSPLPEDIQKVIPLLESVSDFSSAVIEKQVKEWISKNNIPAGNLLTGLRLLLVGGLRGPHLFDIMEILGKEETVTRLRTGLSKLSVS